MKSIRRYSPLIYLAILAIAFLPAQRAAADAWQIQQKVRGAWNAVGEYPDKLGRANKIIDAVAAGGKAESDVRCFNPAGPQTINYAEARAFITSASADDLASYPPRSTRTAFSHLWAGGYWGVDPLLLPCRGLGCLKNQPNPLDGGRPGPGACGLLLLFQNLIYLAISIVLYILVPIRFIWGGALIMTSAGSQERFGAGKKMIYNTLIGVLLVLGAFVIVNTFLWLLGNPLGDWAQIDCVP